MHGSAPWKTEETIVGLPRLLVLSVFSRFGGCHLSAPDPSTRPELGHGHGQAIGARLHGSAPWKTEETIVGLLRLLVLSAFSRCGGCHLSAPRVLTPLKSRSTSSPWDSAAQDCWHKRVPSSGSTQTGPISSMILIVCMV